MVTVKFICEYLRLKFLFFLYYNDDILTLFILTAFIKNSKIFSNLNLHFRMGTVKQRESSLYLNKHILISNKIVLVYQNYT